MRNSYLCLACAVVAGGLFVAGCDKGNTTPAPASNQPAPATNNPMAATTLPSVDLSQVQPMIDKVQQDVGKMDWKAADADLQPLEQMKDKLTPQLQATVTSLRQAVDKGKAVPSTTPAMPGMPAMPH